MELEIISKKENILLGRTEINFTIKQTGGATPSREIIRTELADKLNEKKENIIVDIINSSFGKQEVTGYAKVYPSVEKSKGLEREHILVRNKLLEKKQKEKKEKAAKPDMTKREKPAEPAKKEAAPKVETKEPTPEKKDEKKA